MPHFTSLRTVVPVVGKRIKAFKKWQEAEPDPKVEDKDADKDGEPNEDPIGEGLEEED